MAGAVGGVIIRLWREQIFWFTLSVQLGSVTMPSWAGRSSH
jgi:hypothetical protein